MGHYFSLAQRYIADYTCAMRFLVLAAIALLQPATPLVPKHSPYPPIQSDRFARDLRDKNIGDILSISTPTSVFVEPSGKTYTGEQELRELYEQVTTTYDSDLHLTTTRTEHSKTFAIEHGTYTETLRTRATGATQEVHGTYVFVHERQPNGEWLIARQTWTGPPLH
jgi:ketosteroid isomerase-like protein